MTQGERLARIETILETQLAEMRTDVKAIRTELDADKADLAAIKNRGAGILIGVALAAGGLGAAATKLVERLMG